MNTKEDAFVGIAIGFTSGLLMAFLFWYLQRIIQDKTSVLIAIGFLMVLTFIVGIFFNKYIENLLATVVSAVLLVTVLLLIRDWVNTFYFLVFSSAINVLYLDFFFYRANRTNPNFNSLFFHCTLFSNAFTTVVVGLLIGNFLL